MDRAVVVVVVVVVVVPLLLELPLLPGVFLPEFSPTPFVLVPEVAVAAEFLDTVVVEAVAASKCLDLVAAVVAVVAVSAVVVVTLRRLLLGLREALPASPPPLPRRRSLRSEDPVTGAISLSSCVLWFRLEWLLLLL